MTDRAQGGLWRRFCRSWSRGGLVLIALCAAVYLPGLSALPPVDRDECRFAQASRQMFESVALPTDHQTPALHSGGLVVPMLVDAPRLNKPPLVYWLQTASGALFTLGNPAADSMWMYRLPSALCALAAVLATWRTGLKMFDARAAFLAGVLLALSPIVVWDAHQARADQLLLACTTVCMGALWSVWRGRCTPVHIVTFWLALAAGVMAKGPVTPLVAGLAIVWLCATTRSWALVSRLRPLMGLTIVGVCVLPWVLAVAQRQGGVGSYATLVWNEFFARGLRGSKEGHFAPPGMHTVLLAALFWPGSLATLGAFAQTWTRAHGQAPRAPGTQPSSLGVASWLARALGPLRTRWVGHEREMFLVAWIVPMWLVFELSLAKLPHYTMPLYPAIALLSARALLSLRNSVSALGLNIWTGIGMCIVLIPAQRIAMLLWNPDTLSRPVLVVGACVAALLFAGLIVALLVRAALSHQRGKLVQVQLCACAAAVMGIIAAFTMVLPGLVPGAPSAALCDALREIDAGASRPIGTTLTEDSMIFGTRGRAQRLAPDQVLAWTEAHPTGLLVASRHGATPPPAGWRIHPIAAQRDQASLPWRAWTIMEREP